MTENPDDRTTNDEVDPAEVKRRSQTAAGSRESLKEPLISGDPLGLGGEQDPDAPSRRPRPKLLALAGEFLRMSRTTAILLTAFVLVGVLYLVVKEEPAVNLRPREPAVSSETTTTPDTTGETKSSESTAPTSSAGETSSSSGATPTSEVMTTPGSDDETVEPTVRNFAPATPSSSPIPATPSSSVPIPGGAGEAAPTGLSAPGG